jgi:hypothetical protein
MAASNRAAIFAKTHKVLKKHYTAVLPPTDRTVLEHIVYALCLENSHYEPADAVYARLKEEFFDWNELRVSTVAELTAIGKGLPDPSRAMGNVKQFLHSIFESRFSFDLEECRKQNIGKTVKELEGFKGITPFAIGYVVQAGLSGHAIAIDAGLLGVMRVLGAISEAEAAKGNIPGMERAIPKTKGAEFASLVHQLAADYHASPHSPRIRPILLEIDPESKTRLPKRKRQKTEEKQASATKPGKKPAAKKGSDAKKPAKKAPGKKRATPKKAAKKVTNKSATAKKKSAAKKKKATPKTSASRKLSKRKPR